MRQNILSFSLLVTVMIVSTSALTEEEGGNFGAQDGRAPDAGSVNDNARRSINALNGGLDGNAINDDTQDKNFQEIIHHDGFRRRSFLARRKQGHVIHQRRRSEADETEEKDEEEEEEDKEDEINDEVPNSDDTSDQEKFEKRQEEKKIGEVGGAEEKMTDGEMEVNEDIKIPKEEDPNADDRRPPLSQ